MSDKDRLKELEKIAKEYTQIPECYRESRNFNWAITEIKRLRADAKMSDIAYGELCEERLDLIEKLDSKT